MNVLVGAGLDPNDVKERAAKPHIHEVGLESKNLRTLTEAVTFSLWVLIH